VNQQEAVFKLSTGAKVTAVSETVYQSLGNITLQKPSRSLVGPDYRRIHGNVDTCLEQPVYAERKSKVICWEFQWFSIVRVAGVSDDYGSYLQQTYHKVFTELACKGNTKSNLDLILHLMLHVISHTLEKVGTSRARSYLSSWQTNVGMVVIPKTKNGSVCIEWDVRRFTHFLMWMKH